MKNDFATDLAFSHSCEDLPCWREIYHAAFPSLNAIVDCRDDGQHQRAGIDRVIVLKNGKSILIDEKARRVNYNDIALEYIANDKHGSPGWVEKHLLCDYIAYAILPLGKAYLLPVIQLQAAWQKNKDAWMNIANDTSIHWKDQQYRIIRATNAHYNTISLCLPVPVLFQAIGCAFRVDFTPILQP